MKQLITLILLSLTLCGQDISIYTNSFECEKIKENTIENKICLNKELKQLDKKLLEIYNSFYFLSNQIKSDQSTWIKKRNQCKDLACIKKQYKERINRLQTSLSNQNSFPKQVLDTMYKAQKNMKLTPRSFDKKEEVQKAIKFNDEFYRFENIKYKKPIINELLYKDEKIKNLLGSCYKYRLDLEVKQIHKKKYYEDSGRKFWTEDKRKSYSHRSISIWKTKTEGKEWFLVKIPKTSMSAYLIDPRLCKQKEIKDTITEALNFNNKQIKMARLSLDNLGMVIYKEEEYLFEMSIIDEVRIDFAVIGILGMESNINPVIRLVGYSINRLTYEPKKIEEKDK